MNSVERIVHYATQIEQEAPHNLLDHKPPSGWPSKGRVELKDVVLNYRPELPPVLKGAQCRNCELLSLLNFPRHFNDRVCWREDRHCWEVSFNFKE